MGGIAKIMAQGMNNAEQKEKKMYWSLSLTDWQILALQNVHEVTEKQIDKESYMHALFCEIEQGN